MDESIIQSAKSFIQDLFRNDAGGHDVSHTMRVYRNTLEIAASEPDCDADLAALAALLHDADDHKLFATEHNANARAFLEGEHVPADEIEAVCEIINTVSFSQNRGRRPDTLEGQIVQDADRLDAMGAVGIARTNAMPKPDSTLDREPQMCSHRIGESIPLEIKASSTFSGMTSIFPLILALDHSMRFTSEKISIFSISARISAAASVVIWQPSEP